MITSLGQEGVGRCAGCVLKYPQFWFHVLLLFLFVLRSLIVAWQYLEIFALFSIVCHSKLQYTKYFGWEIYVCTFAENVFLFSRFQPFSAVCKLKSGSIETVFRELITK